MTTLPPVTAEVAAAALESLPTRLRKRADSAAAKAANWPVAVTDATVVVRVDDSTTVTLTTTAGVVTSAEDAVCSCLLAPACLHRAAVLTLAPLAEETDGPAATAVVPSDAGDSTPVVPPETGALDLTPPQSAAVDALRVSATALLAAGVTGSGAVHRATLLHAAHSARVAGLHRAAAAAVRVARRLSEAGTGDPAFRLPELASELAELLTVAVGLRRAPDPDLIGTARRAYTANGSLRLHGLFTEPVVTASGYAGAGHVRPRTGRPAPLAVRRGAGRRRPRSTGRGLRGPRRQRPHPAGTGRPRRGDPHRPDRLAGRADRRWPRGPFRTGVGGPLARGAARHALAAFPGRPGGRRAAVVGRARGRAGRRW